MTTRPELSKQNKYWVDKYRFYELKYLCLQYPTWKKKYESIDGLGIRAFDRVSYSRAGIITDPTANAVEEKLIYFKRMELVEQVAFDADPDLASYILKAVTEGLSYAHLKTRLEIPCGKDMYYDRYRRFFWLLSRARDVYV